MLVFLIGNINHSALLVVQNLKLKVSILPFYTPFSNSSLFFYTDKFAGVSCIISDSEFGLNGAVALQLGEASVVQVLVPRRKKPSSLYRINVQLQPVLNPLLSEVLILRSAQAKLKVKISGTLSCYFLLEISKNGIYLSRDTLLIIVFLFGTG